MAVLGAVLPKADPGVACPLSGELRAKAARAVGSCLTCGFCYTRSSKGKDELPEAVTKVNQSRKLMIRQLFEIPPGSKQFVLKLLTSQ